MDSHHTNYDPITYLYGMFSGIETKKKRKLFSQYVYILYLYSIFTFIFIYIYICIYIYLLFKHVSFYTYLYVYVYIYIYIYIHVGLYGLWTTYWARCTWLRHIWFNRWYRFGVTICRQDGNALFAEAKQKLLAEFQVLNWGSRDIRTIQYIDIPLYIDTIRYHS